MLDDKGHVLSSTELIRRAERVLSEGAAQPRPQPPAATDQEVQGARPSDRKASGRANGLRSLAQIARRGMNLRPGRSRLELLEKKTEQLASHLRWVETELQRCLGTIDIVRRQAVAIRIQIASMEQPAAPEAPLGVDAGELAVLHAEVSGLLERLGIPSSSGADIDYAGFEDRFRGESADLKAQQAEYLGFFPPPEAIGKIVDVGCGRGEMVEVLLEAGHEALGVDMDAGMVETCEAKGLPVVQDNAIHYLEGAPEGSLKGIFCAQVIEHLLTSEIERFLVLSLERLRPGGVLLVETINPRSLHALGNHFFADLSHVRPVHPETLRFLCEQVGYSKVDLHERSLHPLAARADQLDGVPLADEVAALLRGVYGFQDYAIVATK